jgi:hypothetical protein
MLPYQKNLGNHVSFCKRNISSFTNSVSKADFYQYRSQRTPTNPLMPCNEA